MKKLIYLFVFTLILSCNNERVLQLPEIENAEITEVLDVSPVYIFYDETQPDSTLFNRKNLIGTTNWLVNVDKRLTLRQAIPHIQYLQNKRKKESMHKNEAAKNYFTCNDTSIKNLGFLEFTDVNFDTSEIEKEGKDFLISSTSELDEQIYSNDIFIKFNFNIDASNINTFVNDILSILNLKEASSEIEKSISARELLFNLYFDKNLSFQDYISIKSKLTKDIMSSVKFNKTEFIY
ncbi:MAG: hypothetical protein KDD26_10305 [Winogradskyella sp.]|nr:hypothetical protein [Winogradskyella sp.]